MTQRDHLRARVAAVVQEQLRKAGIVVDLVTVDPNAIFNRWSQGDYDSIYFGTQASATARGSLALIDGREAGLEQALETRTARVGVLAAAVVARRAAEVSAPVPRGCGASAAPVVSGAVELVLRLIAVRVVQGAHDARGIDAAPAQIFQRRPALGMIEQDALIIGRGALVDAVKRFSFGTCFNRINPQVIFEAANIIIKL